MDLIFAIAAFLATLLAGTLAILWLVYWRKQVMEEPPPEDPMQPYRALLDSGEIDNEEFERIRRDLAKPDSSPSRE
jgi:hypothetical protein